MQKFKSYCPICKEENPNSLEAEFSSGINNYIKLNVRCMHCGTDYNVTITNNMTAHTLSEYLKQLAEREGKNGGN